jgi:hypothetical protein
MNRNDEYRRNAAVAQEQADKCVSDLDRESWLRVAQGWLGLIRTRPTASEKFEAAAAEQGTKQENSESSH